MTSVSTTSSILAVCLLLEVIPAWPAQSGALELEARIPLGAVSGRIDHLAIDLTRHRLFVAELGNGSLSVVDLDKGQVLKRMGGLSQPQGVAYLPATDTVYLASGGDGSLKRFGGNDLAPLGVTDVGEDADNIRLDASADHIVVGYGRGALAFIDAASEGMAGEVALAGHPEAFQLEASGSRIFVNVPEARQIAVVARDAKRQIAAWQVPGRDNFPMALDEAGSRLLVVDRDPPELLVLDTSRGELMARLPTCGDADDVFVDRARQRAYVSCGEGFIDVVRQDSDVYERLARIPTSPGARTALFVPEMDRLYLAARAQGSEGASVWVLRPEP